MPCVAKIGNQLDEPAADGRCSRLPVGERRAPAPRRRRLVRAGARGRHGRPRPRRRRRRRCPVDPPHPDRRHAPLRSGCGRGHPGRARRRVRPRLSVPHQLRSLSGSGRCIARAARAPGACDRALPLAREVRVGRQSCRYSAPSCSAGRRRASSQRNLGRSPAQDDPAGPSAARLEVDAVSRTVSGTPTGWLAASISPASAGRCRPGARTKYQSWRRPVRMRCVRPRSRPCP